LNVSQAADNSAGGKPDADPQAERVWEEGWEGHERLQRQRMARLTLAQKLEWLEEAQRLAQTLTRQRRSAMEDRCSESSESR
jgi:hypothetical protein